ncbi:MAG: hypothetical protein AAF596_07760 [Planctomycetota bacterium]
METPRGKIGTAIKRRRLPSARQAGWALSLVTLGSLAVGVAVVRGIGGGARPPAQIDSIEEPFVDNGPTFQILEEDGDGFGANDSPDSVWPESLFEPAPAVEVAQEPDTLVR